MIDEVFGRVAGRIALWSGSPAAFGIALGIVAVWAISGPLVGYSELWQLAINTGTTIVTFLMVFLIQNSQNRDTRALQIKLDELIHATKGADDALINLEEAAEADIAALHDRYCAIAERARQLGYEFQAGKGPVKTKRARPRKARARSDRSGKPATPAKAKAPPAAV